MLEQVTTGSPAVGQRVVIYSREGVGKTTLMMSAPRPLLIPMENGFTGIAGAHTPLIPDWPTLTGLLDEITASAKAGKNGYNTLCFDGGTALDRLIDAQVIKDDPKHVVGNKGNLTMETAHGGYGKAYLVANERFSQFTRYCDDLAFYAGIHIMISCHAFSSKVVDPSFGEYNSWDILMHSPKNDKNYGRREMITQWADLVGFLHDPFFITKGADGKEAARATTGQGRMLAVDRAPSYVAKNRYGLSALIPIPEKNGWNNVAHAIYANRGIDTFNRDV